MSNAAFQARREARAAVADKLDKITRNFATNAAQCAHNAAELQTVVFYTIKDLEKLSGELKGDVQR